MRASPMRENSMSGYDGLDDAANVTVGYTAVGLLWSRCRRG